MSAKAQKSVKMGKKRTPKSQPEASTSTTTANIQDQMKELMDLVRESKASSDKRFELLEKRMDEAAASSAATSVPPENNVDDRSAQINNYGENSSYVTPKQTPAGHYITEVLPVGSHLKSNVVAALAEWKFVHFKDLLPTNVRKGAARDSRDCFQGNLNLDESSETPQPLLFQKVKPDPSETRDLHHIPR